MPGEVNIKLYQERDRQSVYKIAADTAFFGDPVETYLHDRQLPSCVITLISKLSIPGDDQS